MILGDPGRYFRLGTPWPQAGVTILEMGILARYVVKITKMWRKLGAWFWIAT